LDPGGVLGCGTAHRFTSRRTVLMLTCTPATASDLQMAASV